ncbi:MAG TPA: ATP-binding protein, partial [Pyrinomonadaceae bacterium]|nr:ATP-binding protein [Pyrinomonadaceae bacterium]
NLAHRIDVLAEDELALLVAAFNQMAADLQENQQKLEERRRYIETVFQSLSTGVISLDEENRVTTINAAAASMLGLENAAGENLTEIIPPEDRAVLEKLITRARRLGHASEQTVLLKEHSENGNGISSESLPVALAATALPESADKKRGVVLVIEDLSELLAAQRAAAWQEVARRMAHEIKNPLTPIQLAAERIAKNFYRQPSVVSRLLPGIGEGNGQLAKIVDESTNTIITQVGSLKAMVDEFAQFARLPHARLDTGDLNTVVRQTTALYQDRLEDVNLETDLGENLPAAMIDEEQIRRVFVNLIDNALEAFGSQKGKKQIVIKTSYDAPRDSLIVEIADNGKGIASGDFAKLFQPYFSTKGRGTGLGLAIVQRIIVEHGGKIRAVPNQPRGARFVIELPVANV